MNIEKHIRQLLFEQNCVIIPEFGGFIANYVSAEIHPIHHVFAPPSKYIAFNELLKVNDGLLISQIASSEEISREDAGKAVKEFVKELSEKINTDKKYYFEEIGTLYLNHEQKLQFDPEKTINYLNASFGLPDLEFKPIERQSAFRTKDRLPKNEVKATIEENTINELTEQRKKSFSKLQAAIIPVLIFLAVAFGYFWFLDKGDNALSSFNPFPIHNHRSVENKKILVVQTPETTNVSKSDHTDMIPTDVANEKEVIEKEKTVETKEVIKEAPKKIKKETVKSGVRYYVIVGGFGSEANAEKLVTKLKSEGHPGAKVLAPSGNNLHKVSSGDFETSKEADNEAQTLKDQFSGAWVYKK